MSTFDRQTYWLLRDVNRAVRAFHMIEDGDRVAVALSGGKDSFSLLRLLRERQKSSPDRYELAAIHVIGDARGPQTEPHAPLLDWLAGSGLPHAVVPVRVADSEELPMGCQRCTWNRRRTLFEAAQRLGCNVVAFGHHADDLAQTTLLNLLYGGRVETMAPRRDYFGGLLRVVRPLCYLPERNLRRYARGLDLPSPPPDCPQSDKSLRRSAAEWIAQVEQFAPDAKIHLLKAGLWGNSQPDNDSNLPDCA